MGDSEQLAKELHDELGTDAQYLYGPERHFPVPAELIQFATELLLVYLAALLNIEGLAERNRKQLMEFVRRIRNGRAAEEHDAKGEADALVEKARAAGRLDDESARAQLVEALIEVGVPRRRAEQHAASVAEKFRSRLR
jgi:hypothetical protein